jgi:hypothetical protein
LLLPVFCSLTKTGQRGGISIPKFSSSKSEANKVAQALAAVSVVRNACDLDLFVFLKRHPRSLLSTEQLAAFMGYPMNQIAESIEGFIAAGILDRTQNPAHAARLYQLKIFEPDGDGPSRLRRLASTRQGRQSILQALRRKRSEGKPGAPKVEGPLLRIA